MVELTLNRVQLHETTAMLHGELPPGAYLCLTVDDCGPGIAPEVLARMFDPFFTTKTVGEGTGLGLSVVHGIVLDLGGAINVAQREPHGTRVTVWLPVCGETAVPTLPTTAAVWPTGSGQAVMVVDNDRALLELAEELLAGLGYEPVGYLSAEAALVAFDADPDRFDAVITDLALTGMQGDALAIRLLALRPALPILLMSGNLSAAVEHAARASGVRAVLNKPLGLQEMAETLAQLLASSTLLR